jgi:hypothetical protein
MNTTSPTRMQRLSHSTTRVVALVATTTVLVLVFASTAGSATRHATVTPPRNIPDLSKMAVAVIDFTPGAQIRRQGYVRPEAGFVASYTREFRPGTPWLGGKRFAFVDSDVELARTPGDARLYYALFKLFSGAIDPDELAAEMRKDGIRVRYARIGKATGLGAGNQSFVRMIRIGTQAGEIRFLIVGVRVHRVVGLIGMVGVPRAKIGAAEAKLVARAVAGRMLQEIKPVATTPPVISGDPTVGQTLTTSRGSWRNSPGRFAYAWSRCDVGSNSTACTPIAGATAPAYTLVAADQGFTVRSHVTATNAQGTTSATSDPTLPIVPGPGAPTSTVAPSISGSTSVGQTLTAEPGSWTGSPTFAYAWYRCDASGSGCLGTPIGTGQTYALAAADAGSRIKLSVTGSNAAGWATAEAPLTAVIAT